MSGKHAYAEPEPSVAELKKSATELHSQLERLTEQYNGLRVRRDQARRAAKAAASSARRQEGGLAVAQEKVGRLAATGYMNGGLDKTLQLATSQEPQTFLDQAATLHYFAQRDGGEVRNLLAAIQSAQRTRMSAEARAVESQRLEKEAKAKKAEIEKKLTRVRDKILRKAPGEIGNLPAIVGAGRGAIALRAAMTRLGKPYVFGGSGPDVFDCSGLVMWAYRHAGVNLPHYVPSQYSAGTPVPRNQLQPGDIVVFYPDMHHNGMYIGNGKMIHAPHTGDVVRIVPLAGRPYYGAVRIN